MIAPERMRTVTSDPKRCIACASSSPIGPPPMTTCQLHTQQQHKERAEKSKSVQLKKCTYSVPQAKNVWDSHTLVITNRHQQTPTHRTSTSIDNNTPSSETRTTNSEPRARRFLGILGLTIYYIMSLAYSPIPYVYTVNQVRYAVY